MRREIIIVCIVLLIIPSFLAAESLLQSGPMVGYSEMREVMLWAQTTVPAKVQFKYWDKEDPKKILTTDVVLTSKQTVNVAKAIADQVKPGKRYEYQLFINGKKVDRPYPLEFQTIKQWKWRSDPPDLKFATGSGTFINDTPYDRPGDPYGGEYEIFTRIYEAKPDFMLWLGDNIYLREADWNTRTGILYRYTHTRSTPEMQPLLGSIHNYAIWDDHDFGPNNSDRGVWNKDTTLEGFKLFWGNPSYGVNGNPGTATTFEWGDAQFFLLDNRFYRAPNYRTTGERTILGEDQLEWLIDNLKSSEAVFKFIVMGGQFLNPVAFQENYMHYPEERERILDALQEERISGVIFITGDRHFTELAKLKRYKDYPLYEFTVSPLTSSVYMPGENEQNFLREEGSLILKRNFGVIEITGKSGERQLRISAVDSQGNEVWSKVITQKELE